jgi:hypothetical protein
MTPQTFAEIQKLRQRIKAIEEKVGTLAKYDGPRWAAVVAQKDLVTGIERKLELITLCLGAYWRKVPDEAA